VYYTHLFATGNRLSAKEPQILQHCRNAFSAKDLWQLDNQLQPAN
jgi:hypothetical protein